MFKALFLFLILVGSLNAQLGVAPDYPSADERYKVDVLCILAHPDDETAIGSLLAKLIFDDQKQVAMIYLNRGNGGGNSIGAEQSMSLANIREIEVRRALAKFNIFNVWILNGKDTPGQDVFKSLHNASHGESLEEIVRHIRLTRPEVIITWMPAHVAGENHGDHQAAGILATEAFDLAGDPTTYAAQITPPRDHIDIDNYQEGLSPWQVKKIYYFSDREQIMPGPGPKFDMTQISKSKGVPYFKLAAQLHTPHLAQGDVAQIALKAISTGDYTEFKNWLKKYRLIFGKSHVECNSDDDLFSGIYPGMVDFRRPSGMIDSEPDKLYIKIGGVFDFYHRFCQSHDISHISNLISPEIMIAGGSFFHFPILIRNNTNVGKKVELQAIVPDDWHKYAGEAEYRLNDSTYPVSTMMQAPYRDTDEPDVIKWIMKVDGITVDSVRISVHLREWTLPQ